MAASRFQTLISRHAFLPSFFFFFFFFISSFSFSFIWLAAESYASEADFPYTNCSLPFTCGPPSTSNITYPFWGNGRASYCGVNGSELGCQDDDYAFMDFEGQRYRVLDINQTGHVMTAARDDLWSNPCLKDPFRNTTMDNNTLFDYTSGVKNLSIFYCPSPGPELSSVPGGVPCPLGGYPDRIALLVEDEDVDRQRREYPELSQCNIVKVPVLQSALDEFKPVQVTDWMEVLQRGFRLAYTIDRMCPRCESSDGICGTNSSYPYNFVCYCSDKPYPYACPLPGMATPAMAIPPNPDANNVSVPPKDANNLYVPPKKNLPVKIVTVAVGVAVGGIVIFVSIILYLGKRLRPVLLKGQKGDQIVENFIKQHGSLAPKRFTYSQVKRMTDSFGSKLGQGGFGAVYGGKLPDSTLVAVKLLNASRGNGEEFINEVASISRTSHINIVALLGFCYEGQRRALIYEFMSNGSLDKFIHDENALRDGTGLPWDKLYQIAVGIARGLEYLHRGCSMKILHFDIKPQNILLDDEFCPKISDFGLSKLCLNRESIVSMLVARGTVGYIAPEVFSRNFGGVSHKSDVYSYGMMLLEMAGGRKNNLNDGADRSSEVYFHDQVYQLIEDGYDRGLYSQLTEEDRETARKMALVGVWCIQTDPKQRPSMGRVIEMLEGTTEDLPIPPKPFLFSPPRQLTLTGSLSISVSM